MQAHSTVLNISNNVVLSMLSWKQTMGNRRASEVVKRGFSSQWCVQDSPEAVVGLRQNTATIVIYISLI